ncbi:MAG TPA: Mur ligase family protein [Candidatus Eisenbacteria bacterium]|nr:Mur ligase family protein [Candidatus Eisenbacteria bacterium]
MLLLLCEGLFLLFALRVVFFWVNLWQLKEYRLDRLLVHLKDTQQGKGILFSKEILLLIVLFSFYFLGIFSDLIARVYPILVILLFLYFAIQAVREILQRKVKRPVFTMKAIGVIFLSIVIIGIVVAFPLTDSFFWMICLGIALPFIVSLVVFLFAFPTEVYTDIFIQKAKQKRKLLKRLTVIAVSGSYGKSSTKEVIAHVLSKRFSVVKTNLSHNTPLALAKTIMQKVDESTDIFVSELGAYKKGEIATLSEIVRPTISVTTAVSDQHIALYGSMQDVISSEMELINYLPKSATTLLNADSKGVVELSKKIKNKTVFWYTTKHTASRAANTFYAYDIVPSPKGIDWKCRYKDIVMTFHSPLLGVHTVANILPAVALGLQFGLSPLDIQKAVKSLRPLPKTMERVEFQLQGTVCIDDSFNASPESVSAAISYLHLFPKRKILVMSPLIELGKMGKQRHYEIGQQMANLDVVMVTNKNFYNDILSGIQSKNGKARLLTGSYSFLAKSLKESSKNGDVIVFEGKEAGIVLKYLS